MHIRLQAAGIYLQIPVYNPVLMQVFQCLQNLPYDRHGLYLIKTKFLPEMREEISASDQLLENIDSGICRDCLVYAHDIRLFKTKLVRAV